MFLERQAQSQLNRSGRSSRKNSESEATKLDRAKGTKYLLSLLKFTFPTLIFRWVLSFKWQRLYIWKKLQLNVIAFGFCAI